MKKKKVLSMMLVGTRALGMLAGCGGKEESAEAGGEESLEKAETQRANSLLERLTSGMNRRMALLSSRCLL